MGGVKCFPGDPLILTTTFLNLISACPVRNLHVPRTLTELSCLQTDRQTRVKTLPLPTRGGDDKRRAIHSNCDSEIDSLLMHMLPCWITYLFPDTFHVVVCFSTIRPNLSL